MGQTIQEYITEGYNRCFTISSTQFDFNFQIAPNPKNYRYTQVHTHKYHSSSSRSISKTQASSSSSHFATSWSLDSFNNGDFSQVLFFFGWIMFSYDYYSNGSLLIFVFIDSCCCFCSFQLQLLMIQMLKASGSL